jgi:hypothetical protein
MEANMRAIVFITLLAFAGQAAALEWTICEGTPKESISEVVLKPDPPSPGVTAEFSIKGNSGEGSVDGFTTSSDFAWLNPCCDLFVLLFVLTSDPPASTSLQVE